MECWAVYCVRRNLTKNLRVASIDWKTTRMRHLLDLFVRNPLSRGEILDESWPFYIIKISTAYFLFFYFFLHSETKKCSIQWVSPNIHFRIIYTLMYGFKLSSEHFFTSRNSKDGPVSYAADYLIDAYLHYI